MALAFRTAALSASSPKLIYPPKAWWPCSEHDHVVASDDPGRRARHDRAGVLLRGEIQPPPGRRRCLGALACLVRGAGLHRAGVIVRPRRPDRLATPAPEPR